MTGFNQDSENKKYSGTLYHSASLEGLVELLNSPNYDLELSCSTENSTRLFGRECVLVMKVENEEGGYTPFDSDAGKNYGWDEFRFNINENFRSKISHVILSPRLQKIWDEEDWDEDEEELELLYEIIEQNGIKFVNDDNTNSFYNF